jgi:hypothetical protein
MVGGLWVILTGRLSGKFTRPAGYSLVSLKSINIILLAFEGKIGFVLRKGGDGYKFSLDRHLSG